MGLSPELELVPSDIWRWIKSQILRLMAMPQRTGAAYMGRAAVDIRDLETYQTKHWEIKWERSLEEVRVYTLSVTHTDRYPMRGQTVFVGIEETMLLEEIERRLGATQWAEIGANYNRDVDTPQEVDITEKPENYGQW